MSNPFIFHSPAEVYICKTDFSEADYLGLDSSGEVAGYKRMGTTEGVVIKEFDLTQVKVSNPKLSLESIDPISVSSDYPCKRCRERGFIPRVWQGNCPECFGIDLYGQDTYCAECEFCCGC